MSGGRPPNRAVSRLPVQLPWTHSPPSLATSPVSSHSRRTFLAVAAATGTALLGWMPSVAAATVEPVGTTPSTGADVGSSAVALEAPVTVMTQNLYVGTNLFALFDLESPTAVPGAIADLLGDVDASDPARRLAAVVDDIERVRLHLVGLQEVALVRVQSESDSDRNATPNATVRRVDFLQLLTAELGRRALPYRVVGRVVNADIEVPAEDRSREGELMDVRLTDRDVVLARDDVHVRGSLANRYGVALTAPYGERTVTVHRGYCATEAVVDGRDLVFVTTHLETGGAPSIQYSQALELGATFQAVPVPVVLAGDFNCLPGSETYRLVTEIFADADAVAAPDGTEGTCCRPPRLATDDPALGRRIDFVFTRGDVRARYTEPVGVTPLAAETRDASEPAAEVGPMWPSDHAGLAAGLDVTPFRETLRRQRAAGLATARQSARVATKQAELVSQLLAARLDRAGDEAASQLPSLLDRVWSTSTELGEELTDGLGD